MARKSGILGGIVGFMLAFIAKIPVYQNVVISFNIYKFTTTEFYIWGIIGDGEGFIMNSENLLTLTFWLILIFISLSSIFASLKKSIRNNSLKLYNLNIFFSSILLIVYTIQIIISNLSNLGLIFMNIRMGFYLIVIILILNVMAKSTLKKEE